MALNWRCLVSLLGLFAFAWDHNQNIHWKAPYLDDKERKAEIKVPFWLTWGLVLLDLLLAQWTHLPRSLPRSSKRKVHLPPLSYLSHPLVVSMNGNCSEHKFRRSFEPFWFQSGILYGEMVKAPDDARVRRWIFIAWLVLSRLVNCQDAASAWQSICQLSRVLSLVTNSVAKSQASLARALVNCRPIWDI